MNISDTKNTFNEEKFLKFDLPYEKYERYGIQYLSDEELIALVLRFGTSGSDVFDTVLSLFSLPALKRFGLSGLLRCDRKDLLSLKGIGKVKSSQLMAIIEIVKRIRQSEAQKSISFTSPESIAEYCMEDMRVLEKEEVHVIFLDTRCSLISKKIISIGSLDMSIMSPREVYKNALKENSSSIVVLHNHPSGDPTPSKEDIEVTKHLVAAGDLIGIKLLDHLIIGDNKYVSLREIGAI